MIAVFEDVFDYRNCFGNFRCFEKFNSFKMHFNFELSKTIVDPNLKNFYYAHVSPQAIANPNFSAHTNFMKFDFVKIIIIYFE